MTREDLFVSPDLKIQAWVMDNGEVCWRYPAIIEAFHQLAGQSILILGFDIVTFAGQDGKQVHFWGTSGYSIDEQLRVSPWQEVVQTALELATRGVERTPALTGNPTLLEEAWFCVTTMCHGEDPIREVLLNSHDREGQNDS